MEGGLEQSRDFKGFPDLGGCVCVVGGKEVLMHLRRRGHMKKRKKRGGGDDEDGQLDGNSEDAIEEEEEEEDDDFNPFAQQSPSLETSTGLSSDCEEEAGNHEQQVLEEQVHVDEEDFLVELGSEVEEEEYNYEEEEEEEEEAGKSGEEQESAVFGVEEAFSSCDTCMNFDEESGLGCGHKLEREDCAGEDEGAICKRTRAQYSLADMSLDQLETFLQESDEEDYFPNVDDQEEYRKFLAAVLEEGSAADGCDSKVERMLEEEEDEDDGDFEVEIEEALYEGKNEELVKQRHRIETREKRRVRSQRRRSERLLGVVSMQLRPIAPYVGSMMAMVEDGDDACTSANVRKKVPPVNGFTAHQIGQLHSLIHEHVQLLVQVFSLCILEPTRQHIAIDTHKMLLEMAEKRDTILSWKKTAFPDFCFRPPYIHPSVVEEMPCQSDHGASDDKQDTAKGGSFPPTKGHASSWAPLTSGPVRSLIDVAPISMVRGFLAEIATVVQEYRQRHVQSGTYHSDCEREPLFPSFWAGASEQEVEKRLNAGSGSDDPPTLKPHLKKTMAAALVESTKKQCIALVPKGVAKAVQRFFPLFNPAFFPHKAPPAATANRLLFTDSEDELLAMGLMTYNTDWKAIQQRFLPSKTMHQIFVRQKNRSSARAPENTIKAVRRLKSSPLTPTERVFMKEDHGGIAGDAICAKQLEGDAEGISADKQNAFLADWKPDAFHSMTSALASLSDAEGQSVGRTRRKRTAAQTGDPLRMPPRRGKMATAGVHSKSPTMDLPFYPGASSGGHPCRRLAIRTVKLSPDLPFVNLPPHVHVLSQSAVEKMAPMSSIPGVGSYALISAPESHSRRAPNGDRFHPLGSKVTSRKCGRQTEGAKSGFDAASKDGAVSLYQHPASRPSDADIQMQCPRPSLQQVVPRFHPFFCAPGSAGPSSSSIGPQVPFHPLGSTSGGPGAAVGESSLKMLHMSAGDGERSKGKSSQNDLPNKVVNNKVNS